MNSNSTNLELTVRGEGSSKYMFFNDRQKLTDPITRDSFHLIHSSCVAHNNQLFKTNME